MSYTGFDSGDGATYDPTDFTQPPPSGTGGTGADPFGYTPPDFSGFAGNEGNQSDPTDFSTSSGAAFADAGGTGPDTGYGSDTGGGQKKTPSYDTSDPTDLSGGTDQSNVQQAANPIPTSDPTDFSTPSAFSQPAPSDPTDFTSTRSAPVNRAERVPAPPSYDPTDLSGGTDAGNLAQSANPIQTYDPTDFTTGQQAGRGEQATQTSGFTPTESKQYGDALAPVFAAQDSVRQSVQTEAASLHGENTDLGNRIQAYEDAVNSGTQERDPQFEASLDGEIADLQRRMDEFRTRPDSYYDDQLAGPQAQFQQVAAGIGQQRQDAFAADQGNLQQAFQTAVGDAGATGLDPRNPAVRAELTDPNSPLAYGLDAFPEGPGVPNSVTESQNALQQYGPVDKPVAYYQVQDAPGVYSGQWIPVGTDPAQQAAVQQRANLPKDDPNNIRVVSASTFGVAGPPEPDAVPTTGVQDLGHLAIAAGLGSLLLAPVAVPLGLTLPATGLVGGATGLGLATAGSYLEHGTGTTVGSTLGGIPGGIADILNDVPVADKVSQFIANVPIPKEAQNPLALIEQAAQGIADDPGHRLNPVSLAIEIYKNGIALSPSDETYQYQSGLQKAGLEYLATNTIAFHGAGAADVLTSGPAAFVSLANPIADYRTLFERGIAGGMTPQASADAAYARTTNGITQVLRNLDIFNPLLYAVDVPLLAEATKALFGAVGVTARAFVDSGAHGAVGDLLTPVARLAGIDARATATAAGSFLDLFGQLSLKSATDLSLAQVNREFGTKVGRFDAPGGVGGAIGDLLEAFAYKEGAPAVRAQRLADYAAAYTGDAALAASMSDRLGYGLQQQALHQGVGLADFPAFLEKTIATFRDGTFTPQDLAATARKYTLGAGEGLSLRDTTVPANTIGHYLGGVSDRTTLGNYTALELASSMNRAAMYRLAGLPVVADPRTAQVLATFAATTLRQMFLIPGATALALKKIPDEFIRAVTQGVWGVHPQDLQLVRTGARQLIERTADGSRLNSLARTIESQSTVRQMMAAGLPIDPQLLRANLNRVGIEHAFAGRAALNNLGGKLDFGQRVEALLGAPGRAADKYLDILASSPTQHVRLNAARGALGEALNGGSRAFADRTVNGLAPFNLDRLHPALPGLIRDELAAATNQSDYHRVATALERRAQPVVPQRGMAQGSPARLAADLSRTPRGLVGEAGTAGTIPQADPRAVMETFARNLGRIPTTSPVWERTVSDVTRANARALGYRADAGITNRDLYTAVTGRPPEAIPVRQASGAGATDAFRAPLVGGELPVGRDLGSSAGAGVGKPLPEADERFATAIQYVRDNPTATTDEIQTRFRTGYRDAQRILKDGRQPPGGFDIAKGNVSLTPDGTGIDARGIANGGDYWASRKARDANFRQRVDAAFPDAADGTIGQRVTQSTPTGDATYRYRVVPLDELKVNVPGIQTRPRDTSVLSQQQIARMVRDFQPDRLLADVGAVDTGPPIVGTDRAVESGNGRAMALNTLAHGGEGRPAWEAYQRGLREYAPRYGIDPASLDGIEHPVLIRENLTPFASPAERRAFVDAANATPVLQRTAEERIATDARALTDGLAGRLEVGPTQRIDAAIRSNRDVMRGFVANLQREDPNAVGGLLDSSGTLTTEGVQRFKAALATKAYGDAAGTEIANRIFYRLDEEYKGIGDAVEDILPQMALGVAGKPDLNLGDDLSWALDKLSALKKNGEIGAGGIREWLERPRLMPEEGLTQPRADLLTLLYENKTRTNTIRDFLQNYAALAGNQPIAGQGALALVAPATKDDLLRAALAGKGRFPGAQSGLDLAAGGDGGLGIHANRPGFQPGIENRPAFGRLNVNPLDRTSIPDFGIGTTRGAIPSNRPAARLLARLPSDESDVARYVADVRNRLQSIAPESQVRAVNELRAELHRTQSVAAERALQALNESGIRDPARIAADAARNAPPFNAGDAIKARLDELGIAPTGGLPGPRQIGSDARFTPVQPAPDISDPTDLSGAAGRLRTPSDHGIPSGGTVGNARGIGNPPAPPQADLAGAVAFIRRQGQDYDRYLNRQGAAAVARGNAIIGNFAEQTPIGELLSRGTINGRSPLTVRGFEVPVLPTLPFAGFHIHTAQFWADYFLRHPAVPFAIARTLNAAHVDEYGGTPTRGGYLGGVTNPFTAAHLVQWAMDTYRYARDVLANPNGNNPLQVAAKIVGQPLFGNNAFMRPFDYVGAPAQAALQSATNPLLSGRTDFATGRPLADKREQIAEQGAPSFTGALAQYANTAIGGPLGRNVANALGNPAQPLTNLIRSGAVNLVDRLGGTANLTAYNAEKQAPFFLADYALKSGLSRDAIQKAYYNPQTPEEVALGAALHRAYTGSQDVAGLRKGLPIQFNPETAGLKGIYAPLPPFDKNAPVSHSPGGAAGMPDFYENRADFPQSPGFAIAQNREAITQAKSSDPAISAAGDRFLNANPDKAFQYARNAGTGGRDLGTGVPQGSYLEANGAPNGYYIESPENARYQTARADIAKGTPVTPESVPFMDYNRAYLGTPDIAAMGSAKEQASLAGSLAGNAQRTGAGLPQDARLAQIAKEQVLQRPVGTNPDGSPFTLSDLLKQSGVNDIEARLKGMPKGDAKTALENQLAGIKAELARNSPVASSYFAQQDAAFKASQVNKVTGNAKTDSLNVGIDGTFTVGDFLRQPGNLFEMDQRYADAKARGASQSELTAILKEKDAILASDLRQHPEVRAYFDATGQTKYAENPNGVSSNTSARTASSRSSSSRTSTTRSSRTSFSGTARKNSGSLSGRTSTPSGAAQAGNNFYAEYRTLAKGTPEYKAALSDPAVRGILGAKGATAAQYDAALTALKADEIKARNAAQRPAAGLPSAAGLPGSGSGSGHLPGYHPQFLRGTAEDILSAMRGVPTGALADALAGRTIARLPGSGEAILPAGGTSAPGGKVYTAQQQANYAAIKAQGGKLPRGKKAA